MHSLFLKSISFEGFDDNPYNVKKYSFSKDDYRNDFLKQESANDIVIFIKSLYNIENDFQYENDIDILKFKSDLLKEFKRTNISITYTDHINDLLDKSVFKSYEKTKYDMNIDDDIEDEEYMDNLI